MLLLLAAAIAFTREPDFDDEEIDFDALDEWAAADAGRPLPPPPPRDREAETNQAYDAFGKALKTVKMDCRNLTRFMERGSAIAESYIVDGDPEPRMPDANSQQDLEEFTYLAAMKTVNALFELSEVFNPPNGSEPTFDLDDRGCRHSVREELARDVMMLERQCDARSCAARNSPRARNSLAAQF